MLAGNSKKKIIIVCDAKTEKYGKYMMMLISLVDDKEDATVGLKDGTVEAVLWDEKTYKANSPTLPSSSNVIFIGNSKLAKSEGTYMTEGFNKGGMHFLSLGSRAVAKVDDRLPKEDEYEEFLTLCGKYEKRFERIKLNGAKAGIVLGSLGAVGVFIPVFTPVAVAGLLTAEKRKKDIIEQEYQFLMLYIYMELLTDFLGG